MSNRPKIYIDSPCIIDYAGFCNQRKTLPTRAYDISFIEMILNASKGGDIELYTSTLTIAECQFFREDSTNEKILFNEEIQRVFKSVLTSGRVIFLVQPDLFIAETARDLLWVHNIKAIKGADAIHIASALYMMGCEEFITFDDAGPYGKANDLLKLNLRIIKPSETKCLPMKYLQQNIDYESWKEK